MKKFNFLKVTFVLLSMLISGGFAHAQQMSMDFSVSNAATIESTAEFVSANSGARPDKYLLRVWSENKSDMFEFQCENGDVNTIIIYGSRGSRIDFNPSETVNKDSCKTTFEKAAQQIQASPKGVLHLDIYRSTFSFTK